MNAEIFTRAATATSQVVAGIDKGQLDDPTPCTDWNVRDVLNHMINGLYAVGAGSRGEKVDFNHPQQDFAAGDYVHEFGSAAQEAIAAFSEDGAMEKSFTMSWGDTPGAALIGVSTSDLVIHGWDLAQGTGQPYEIDPEVAEASYGMVTSMMQPKGKMPRGDAFGDPIEVADDAPIEDRLMAYVGRKPV